MHVHMREDMCTCVQVPAKGKGFGDPGAGFSGSWELLFHTGVGFPHGAKRSLACYNPSRSLSKSF